MKRVFVLLSCLTLALGSFAQDAIEKYFSQFEQRDDFTKVSVSAKMFELFTHFEGSSDDEQELLETIANLKGMRMIMKDEMDNPVSFYKEAVAKPGKEFEVLMTLEDETENVTFFIHENEGIINELLLVGRSSNEFFILSLLGKIDLKQVSKLSKVLQIDGMEHLQNLEEKE